MNTKLTVALLIGGSVCMSTGAYALSSVERSDDVNWSYVMATDTVESQNTQTGGKTLSISESVDVKKAGSERVRTQQGEALTLTYVDEAAPIPGNTKSPRAFKKCKGACLSDQIPVQDLQPETVANSTVVESQIDTQYVQQPVKVQYPITRQYPISVQYPVTVQRDITIEQPVVMQQPVIVKRPVVMQQAITVQRKPAYVQQQPMVMQQQPTYIQQKPIIMQAPVGQPTFVPAPPQQTPVMVQQPVYQVQPQPITQPVAVSTPTAAYPTYVQMPQPVQQPMMPVQTSPAMPAYAPTQAQPVYATPSTQAGAYGYQTY